MDKTSRDAGPIKNRGAIIMIPGLYTIDIYISQDSANVLKAEDIDELQDKIQEILEDYVFWEGDNYETI